MDMDTNILNNRTLKKWHKKIAWNCLVIWFIETFATQKCGMRSRQNLVEKEGSIKTQQFEKNYNMSGTSIDHHLLH